MDCKSLIFEFGAYNYDFNPKIQIPKSKIISRIHGHMVDSHRFPDAHHDIHILNGLA
jgi:hypothetical protein